MSKSVLNLHNLLENCYEILGVPNDASFAEIKSAFRKKAKQLHPDTAETNDVNNESFHLLMKAYTILSDEKQREIFDNSFFWQIHEKHKKAKSFDYHEWLSERSDDESKAKLIFWDLMHHREDEAVELFKKMQTEKMGFRLQNFFTREDFMDYGFILAEELVVRGAFYDAFLLLEQIIKMEYSFNYFRLLFPEVINFALRILKHNIEFATNDELALDAFERALDLGFPKKEDAFFLKKIAELYLKMGDEAKARACLEEREKLVARD